MDTYTEGLVVIFVCLTVLAICILGVAVYVVNKKMTEERERNRDERMGLRFLVENMIDILNTKLPYDENKDEESN